MPTRNAKNWIAVIPAMILPGVASLFYFVLLGDRPTAKAVYAAVKIFTVFWPVLCLWLILRERLPRINPRDPKHRKALPLGLLTGAGIAALMFGLMQTPIGAVVRSCAPAVRSKARELGFLDHYWTFAIFLSLVHSLIEEYYWRWFVFGRLRQVVSRRGAHLLAGLAFSAHHVVVLTQYFPVFWGVTFGLGAGVGGVIWSLMYEKQGTLTGAWLSHLIADLAIMTIGHVLLFGAWA